MGVGKVSRNPRSGLSRRRPHGFLLEVVLIVAALLYSEAASGQSAEVTYHFETGNEYYRKGDYRKAIEEYQQVLALGYESPELYYNLGNCYFRLQEIGRAVLYLERARRLDPNDEDIVHNLEVVRLHVADKVPEIPELLPVRWFKAVRDRLSVDAWTFLLLTVYGLTFLVLALRVLVRLPRLSSTLGRVAVCFGVVAAIVALFWFSSVRADNQQYAVILADKVDVRSAPESDATELFSLHEGFRVQVRKQVGDWCEIRLPDGKVGWVQKESLGII